MNTEDKLAFVLKEIEILIKKKEASSDEAQLNRTRSDNSVGEAYYHGVHLADEITADNLRFLLKLVGGK